MKSPISQVECGNSCSKAKGAGLRLEKTRVRSFESCLRLKMVEGWAVAVPRNSVLGIGGFLAQRADSHHSAFSNLTISIPKASCNPTKTGLSLILEILLERVDEPIEKPGYIMVQILSRGTVSFQLYSPYSNHGHQPSMPPPLQLRSESGHATTSSLPLNPISPAGLSRTLGVCRNFAGLGMVL